MEFNIFYDYNIDNVMAPDNLVGEVLKTRKVIALNTGLPITQRKFNAFYNEKAFGWIRVEGLTQLEIEVKEDIVWFRVPINPAETLKDKADHILFVSKDTASIGYWYAKDKLKDIVAYVDDNPHLNTTEEFRVKNLISQNIMHDTYNSLLKVLRPKTTKNIVVVNNDIEIDGKKICGTGEHLNNTGTFQEILVNYAYDDDLFRKILADDDFHRKTGQGITGISNEIPGFTKQEFMEEWAFEFDKLIKEVEDL